MDMKGCIMSSIWVVLRGVRAIRMSSGAREDDPSCSCAVTLAQLPQSGIQTSPTTKGHGANVRHYPSSCTVYFMVA